MNLTESNRNVTWFQTINKENVYYVDEDENTRILNNGNILEIKNIKLINDEFYGCGTVDNINNEINIIESYRLFVRGKHNK
jgi:hypothetical protein